MSCRWDDITHARTGPGGRALSFVQGAHFYAALARHDNLVASLFRLEQCREYDRVELLVSHLIGKLKETRHEGLRRAFAVWLIKSSSDGCPVDLRR